MDLIIAEAAAALMTELRTRQAELKPLKELFHKATSDVEESGSLEVNIEIDGDVQVVVTLENETEVAQLFDTITRIQDNRIKDVEARILNLEHTSSEGGKTPNGLPLWVLTRKDSYALSLINNHEFSPAALYVCLQDLNGADDIRQMAYGDQLHRIRDVHAYQAPVSEALQKAQNAFFVFESGSVLQIRRNGESRIIIPAHVPNNKPAHDTQ